MLEEDPGASYLDLFVGVCSLRAPRRFPAHGEAWGLQGRDLTVSQVPAACVPMAPLLAGNSANTVQPRARNYSEEGGRAAV